MPMYDYRCNACQREFEYQQKMADPDLVTCEVCGEDKLEKLISWSAFQIGSKNWMKNISGKQTPEQQREVARMSVDKGVPPKREKAPAPAPGAPSESASAEPAAAADASTSPSTDGTKE